MMDTNRITPETDAVIRLNRIKEMQEDLAFLFTVNWCDVDPHIQVRVLRHAISELSRRDE